MFNMATSNLTKGNCSDPAAAGLFTLWGTSVACMFSVVSLSSDS